jgi:hypothetical protein
MIKAEIRNPVYRHNGCCQSESVRLRLVILSPDISMPRKKKNGYRSMLDAFSTHALRLIRIGAAVSLHGAPSYN